MQNIDSKNATQKAEYIITTQTTLSSEHVVIASVNLKKPTASAPSKRTVTTGSAQDHLCGATIALNSRYPMRIGLCAVLDGELLIGGLSLSAAVIITFLPVLCHLNGITLSPK